MNIKRALVVVVLAGAVMASPLSPLAAEKQPAKAGAKARPYPLKTCLVQDEKLDADAYVFVHQGQEIKLCCESCKDDFLKEPAKYLKKLEAAPQKPAKQPGGF